MAKSARQAQLELQRTSYQTYRKFGDSIKILGGGGLGSTLTSLAKSNANAELDAKVKQYNDGVISNEEMRSFLQKMSGSSLLSPTDKVEVQNKIRDFDDTIQVSKLEMAYKNAPNDSPAKVSTANALATFFTQKASTQQQDTPAYSNTLSMAAQWSTTAKNETVQIQKKERSLKRAQLFNEVYKQIPNSSEEAFQKSQAFSTLANQALEDGDQLAAAQFQAQSTQAYSDYQATVTREGEKATKEASAANRKQLNDYVNNAYNSYKDGRINADEFLQYLNAADSQAAELGETSVQLRLNSLASSVYRDIEKGVHYTPDGAFGDKSGGGGGAGGTEVLYDPTTGGLSYGVANGGKGSGKATGKATATGKGGKAAPAQKSGPVTLGELNSSYKDEREKLKEYYNQGKISANDYKVGLAAMDGDRANDLAQIYAGLKDIDPNAKIVINGKKQRVGDVLETVKKEADMVYSSAKIFANKNTVPVSAFSTKGDLTNVPTIKFMDVSQLEKQHGKKGEGYIFDAQGTVHIMNKVDSVISRQQYNSMTKEQKKLYQLTSDASGYKKQDKYVDIYDRAGSGTPLRYEYDELRGAFLPVADGTTDPRSVQTLRDNIIKEADAAISQGKKPSTNRPLTPEQLQTYIETLGEQRFKDEAILKQKKAEAEINRKKQIANTPIQLVQKPLLEKTAEAIQAGASKVVDAAKTILPEAPRVIAPAKINLTPEQNDLSTVSPAAMEPIRQNFAQAGSSAPGQPSFAPPQKQIQLATPPKTALSSLPKNSINLPSSAGPQQLLKQNPVPKPYTWVDLGNQIKKQAQGIGTKILSIFKR